MEPIELQLQAEMEKIDITVSKGSPVTITISYQFISYHLNSLDTIYKSNNTNKRRLNYNTADNVTEN